MFVAQKKIFLEAVKWLSGLSKGVVHTKQEHGSSKLVPLDYLYVPALTYSRIAYPALYLEGRGIKKSKRLYPHAALTNEK